MNPDSFSSQIATFTPWSRQYGLQLRSNGVDFEVEILDLKKKSKLV